MNKNLTLTFVDFQNDFVAPNGILSFDNQKGDIALIQRVQNFFKNLSKNIFSHAIITYDTHDKKTYPLTPESNQFPLHCEINTMGWQLAVNYNLITKNIPHIQHLKKSTYDMWANTIDKVDENIINNTNEVVLFGVASDICNKAALTGWLNYDVTITVLTDLTRGIFKQTEDVLKEDPFATAITKGKIKTLTAQAFLQQQKERRRT